MIRSRFVPDRFAMRISSVLLLLVATSQPKRAHAAQSVSCADASHRSLPVQLAASLQSNHFVITVCHGDRPLSFVLDTGAPTSIFDLSVAKELGVQLGSPIRSGGAGAG